MRWFGRIWKRSEAEELNLVKNIMHRGWREEKDQKKCWFEVIDSDIKTIEIYEGVQNIKINGEWDKTADPKEMGEKAKEDNKNVSGIFIQ